MTQYHVWAPITLEGQNCILHEHELGAMTRWIERRRAIVPTESDVFSSTVSDRIRDVIFGSLFVVQTYLGGDHRITFMSHNRTNARDYCRRGRPGTLRDRWLKAAHDSGLFSDDEISAIHVGERSRALNDDIPVIRGVTIAIPHELAIVYGGCF